jgi:hypothetical protein
MSPALPTPATSAPRRESCDSNRRHEREWPGRDALLIAPRTPVPRHEHSPFDDQSGTHPTPPPRSARRVATLEGEAFVGPGGEEGGVRRAACAAVSVAGGRAAGDAVSPVYRVGSHGDGCAPTRGARDPRRPQRAPPQTHRIRRRAPRESRNGKRHRLNALGRRSRIGRVSPGWKRIRRPTWGRPRACRRWGRRAHAVGQPTARPNRSSSFRSAGARRRPV